MRLINADALREKIVDDCINDNKVEYRASEISRMIDEAPTIPCRIASGATWLKDDEKYTGHRVHCSICGYDIDIRVRTNYCPACGSRMDGIPPEWEVKLP